MATGAQWGQTCAQSVSCFPHGAAGQSLALGQPVHRETAIDASASGEGREPRTGIRQGPLGTFWTLPGSSDHRRLARTRLAGLQRRSSARQPDPGLDQLRYQRAGRPDDRCRRRSGGERAVGNAVRHGPAGGRMLVGYCLWQRARGRSSAMAAGLARRGSSTAGARRRRPGLRVVDGSRAGGAATGWPARWRRAATSGSRCTLRPATPGRLHPMFPCASCPPRAPGLRGCRARLAGGSRLAAWRPT